MKVIYTEDRYHTLNFQKGDDVMDGLLQYARDNGIKAAHISGLGAAAEVEIAYYNIETKEYERKTFTEDVEVISLNGNIGIKEGGTTVVHIHGMFGRRDFSTFGGHIFRLIISGAGEVHLATFDGTIHRAFDAETGLTLMCGAE